MHIKINHNNQEENSGSTQSTAWGKITILHWRPRRLHRLQDSQVQHLVDTPSSEYKAPELCALSTVSTGGGVRRDITQRNSGSPSFCTIRHEQ